jgi:protein Mpv17
LFSQPPPLLFLRCNVKNISIQIQRNWFCQQQQQQCFRLTSTIVSMSSFIVDDCNDATNTITTTPSQQQQQQQHILDPTTHQQMLVVEQLIPQQQLQSTTLSKRWMNSGLTIGTLVAIMACLVSLDTPGLWDGTTITETILHIPNELWQQYSMVLADHPIATKACTSATVYTIGDIIAQRSTGVPSNDLDKVRIVRNMIAGLIGHGPMSHCWYNICDGFFADTLHLTAWWAFIPKVIVDQTFWGPIWNNTYLLLMGLMKFERLDVIWEDIKKSTIPMVVSGLKLWPAAHLVTYGLIPVENRLLWVDMVEIVWVTILSKQAASLDKMILIDVNEEIEVDNNDELLLQER